MHKTIIASRAKGGAIVLAALLSLSFAAPDYDTEEIGSRREIFVDRHLVGAMNGNLSRAG